MNPTTQPHPMNRTSLPPTDAQRVTYWTERLYSLRLVLRNLEEHGVPAWKARSWPGVDVLADARQDVANAEARLAEAMGRTNLHNA
jgi:hypothetical protein